MVVKETHITESNTVYGQEVWNIFIEPPVPHFDYNLRLKRKILVNDELDVKIGTRF